MERTKSRRKTLIVDKAFQQRMVFQFVAMNIQTTVIFGVILYIIMEKSMTSAIPPQSVNVLNATMVPAMLGFLVLYLLITSALIAFYVIYSSNKIAGPIYRFNSAIEEMSRGNLVPAVAIREGDHLVETSELFRNLSMSLAGDLSVIKSTIHDLNRHAMSNGDNNLMDKVQRLHDLMGKYRVEEAAGKF